MARLPISLRQKREIKPIEKKSRRNKAFTLRRQTLFKHTEELCKSADSRAAVIVFSESGNAFGFGHPLVGDVIADRNRASASGGAIEAVEPPMTEIEKRLREALAAGRLDWNVVTKGLGVKELEELEEAISRIQRLASERVKKLMKEQ